MTITSPTRTAEAAYQQAQATLCAARDRLAAARAATTDPDDPAVKAAVADVRAAFTAQGIALAAQNAVRAARPPSPMVPQ